VLLVLVRARQRNIKSARLHALPNSEIYTSEYVQISAKEQALGCVNSPPLPEAARTPHHATWGSILFKALYIFVTQIEHPTHINPLCTLIKE